MDNTKPVLKEVIVNHTGSCMGFHYEAGKVTPLPENVIAALGSDVSLPGEKKQEAPKPEPKVEAKDIKKPVVDKMIHGNEKDLETKEEPKEVK